MDTSREGWDPLKNTKISRASKTVMYVETPTGEDEPLSLKTKEKMLKHFDNNSTDLVHTINLRPFGVMTPPDNG